MKKLQIGREQMIALTSKTLNEAPTDAIDAMPGIDTPITALATNVELIRDNAALQSEDLTGIAVEKEVKREVMIDAVMVVSTKGASFAFNSSLPVLLRKVNKPRSYYEKLGASDCAAKCKEVYNVLLPYLTDLLPYGVTPAKLTEVDVAVDKFIDYINEPKENIDERKTVTATIATLLDECDAILEGTDLAVGGLDESHAAFVQKYRNSRELNVAGGRVLSVRGKVTKADGTALKGVKIVFVGTDVVKSSSEKGNFQVRHLAPGVVVVKCSKYGFRDVELTVAINANERSEMVVVMEEVLVGV